MRAHLLALALALSVTAPALAQDTSSTAEEWGLAGETKARFTGQVVDILCTLSGDCPADCGGGRRQLGIVRDDGVLVLPAKNGQFLFTGAVRDLLGYCQARVEVDGLMVGEGAPRIFAVQKLRRIGEPEWRATDRWTEDWSAANPALREMAEEWFRHDPRVVGEIDRSGYLGLGPAADIPFIKAQ